MLQIDRLTVRYLSRRGDDVELRDAIKRVSRERRRFGCRRIHVMIYRIEFDRKKVGKLKRLAKADLGAAAAKAHFVRTAAIRSLEFSYNDESRLLEC